MFDIEGTFDRQILGFAKVRPTVVFPEALDPRVIEAVCYLTRFVRPVFLAPETQVREVIARDLRPPRPRPRGLLPVGERLRGRPRAHRPDRGVRARRSSSSARSRARRSRWTTARRMVMEPARFGIWAVRLDHADTVVGGATHAPKDYFRPMIRLLAKQQVRCEAGVFVLPDDAAPDVFPHNIVVFGDVGVNATMTPEVLAHVAVGTCAVARDLIPDEVLPEIHGVIVSYSNRGSDEGPSPELVRQATALVPDVLAERVDKGERYAHDPHPGRGQGLGGAVPALGHVLRPGTARRDVGRQPQRDHLPEPRDGEPALPPLRGALPRRRRSSPPCSACASAAWTCPWTARPRTSGSRSRPRCCACTASASGSARRATPSSAATACWP